MSRLQLPGIAKAGSADVIRRISPDKQHVKWGRDEDSAAQLKRKDPRGLATSPGYNCRGWPRRGPLR